MQIVQKLTLLFIAGTWVVLAANGYFRVRREVALFESDRVQNQDLLANAMGSAVGAVWRTDGRERALALVGQLDQRAPKLRIGWLDIDDTHTVGADAIGLLRGGNMATLARVAPDGERLRCAYAPVAPSDKILGAVGVCESFSVQELYVRRTILETVATTLGLAVVCALISAVVGFWIVGRPMRTLMAHAHRIGEGDFSRASELRGRDEIALLSREMNAMSERLELASARVEAETRSRIVAIEQLRHADRLMTVGKLASGIAHELGTPLNVIEARAEMIAAGETQLEESRSYARVITEATERMTRILRQLLDFARRGRSQTAPHDVLQLARRTTELLTPLAAKKQLTLEVGGSSSAALVDPEQIQQVFANLVQNAIQATNAPGKIDVFVSEERANAPIDAGGVALDCVRIDVRDRGAGIAPEDLERVFEPFFTTKEVGEGTGLGLAVAYGIVHDHGGWIELVSERGVGTTFSIFLKRAAP